MNNENKTGEKIIDLFYELPNISEDVPEHDTKYNVKKDVLDEANKKITKISTADKNGLKKIKKGDKVLIKRTKKDYDRLWDVFKESELVEFEKTMQYGEKEIKKIGIRKFIDAMDWYYNEDVKKWRTDKLHVMPCVHCGTNFAIYETDLGLCDKCRELYDLERFAQMCKANESWAPGISFGLRVSFVFDKDFRDNYRFKTLKEQISESIAENFKGMNSFLMFKSAIEENRYNELYEELNKHKGKMSDACAEFLKNINDEIQPVINDSKKSKEVLAKFYLV